MDAIQKIYIALFGRPADPAGLAFFANETNNGADLSAIANLSGQDEYQDRFENDDSATIITEIYVELFGRNPELAELTYWLGQFEARGVNNIAIAIAQSAQNDDLTILNNKVAAANLFTASINTPEELAAYRGDAAEAAGRAFLDGVTADPDSVPTQAEADAAVAEIVDNNETGGGTPGSTLTLTADADVVSENATSLQFQSTNNDDTIRATTTGSLESDDVINAANGFDTLNISTGALVTGAAPVLTSVERINNADAGKTLDLSASTGVQQVWSNGASGTYTYTGVAASVVIGASGSDGFAGKAIAVDYSGSVTGTSDTVSFAVDDTNGDGVSFTSTDSASIEGINLVAMGGTGSGTTGDAIDDIVNVAAFNNLETLTISGSGDVNVTADGSDLETVTVTGSGTVTLTLTGGGTQDTTINFGSGAANFNGGAATGELTINGGAGADLLVGGAGDDTINGGAGNDIFGGGAGEDTITGGEGNDEFHFFVGSSDDTVTDFTAGQDVISLLQNAGATGLAFNDSTNSGNRGQSDLNANDFNLLSSFTNLTAAQDQEVVVFTTSFADQAAVNTAVAGSAVAAEVFFVVYNEDAEAAQLYYDAGGASATATLVATLEGLDLADVQALTAANFDIYV